MTDIISEAERLALITREQVRLVNLQADIIEDDGFENQDDRNVHHGHGGRSPRRPYGLHHTATIIPFPIKRRKTVA